MSTPDPAVTEPTKKKKTALDAPRGTVFRMDPDNLIILGLDTDHTPGSHPLYSEAEAGRLEMGLDEDFLLSVKDFGILTAVTVYKMPVRLKGETEAQERAVVVAGRRRVRHAREINKIHREQGHENMAIQVPAAVFSGALEDAGMVTFIENEHRDDTPTLDKARAAARLAARGVPEERICMLFRLSTRGLKQYLKLVQLHPEVLNLFSEGRITLTAAEDIARKEYGDQPEYAKSLIQAGGGTANRRALGNGGATGGDGEVTHNRGFSAGALRKLVTQIPGKPGEDPDVDLVREVVAWVISKEVPPGSRLESVLTKRVKGKPGRKAKKKDGAAAEGTEAGAEAEISASSAGAGGEENVEAEENTGTNEVDTEEEDNKTEGPQEDPVVIGLSPAEPEPVAAPRVEVPPAAAPATPLDMSTLLQGLQSAVSQAVRDA